MRVGVGVALETLTCAMLKRAVVVWVLMPNCSMVSSTSVLCREKVKLLLTSVGLLQQHREC